MIDCGSHGMLETKLTRNQIDRMVAAGWDAVDTYLDQDPR